MSEMNVPRKRSHNSGMTLMNFLSLSEEERQITPGPPTGAVIGGILGALAFIGIIVGIILFIRKRQQDGE